MMIRALLFVLVPGLAVFTFFLGKAAFEAFVLEVCDSKFGCEGGVSFMALIAGLAFALSAISNAIAAFLQRVHLRSIPLKHLLGVVVVVGGVLAYAFTTVPTWPWADLGLMFWWLVLSGVLSWVVLFAATRVRV